MGPGHVQPRNHGRVTHPQPGGSWRAKWPRITPETSHPSFSRKVLEPVKQPFEVVQFHLGPFTFARPAADLVQQLTRTAINIFALQQVVLCPCLPPLTGCAAQRVVLLFAGLAAGLALAALLLLTFLCQLLTKVAHPVAQGLHGLGLLVYRVSKVIPPQGLLGPFHGTFRPLKRLARRLSSLAVTAGHTAPLLFQLAAQRLLAVGQ